MQSVPLFGLFFTYSLPVFPKVFPLLVVKIMIDMFPGLNEDLVTFLMERDDLHMEQDSMLVDIEDLTKHM